MCKIKIKKFYFTINKINCFVSDYCCLKLGIHRDRKLIVVGRKNCTVNDNSRDYCGTLAMSDFYELNTT